MITSYMEFWPRRQPRSLTIPKTTLYDNLQVSAARYPDKAAVYYYGRSISYAEILEAVDSMAGYLEQELHVAKGDRVLLFMQNSPQFLIGYYAILRVGGIVVPVNPMNHTEELRFYVEDSEIAVAMVGQELVARLQPLIGSSSLRYLVVAAYSEYASDDFPYEMPPEVKAEPVVMSEDYMIAWSACQHGGFIPTPYVGTSDDIAVLPYTSGTTGRPKGCIHTHKTMQANVVATIYWSHFTSETVAFATLPYFHVTGMQHSMNAPLFTGSTIVMMTRWNRDVAGELIQSQQCTHWTNISTMVIDFLSNPNLERYNLASMRSVGGGGAPLPAAIGEKLLEKIGVQYVEGYGLSETISQSHVNPPDRAKLQCLGIPSYGVDARIVDPETLRELGPNEEGELLLHGPQVFKGYWNRPDETAKAFVEIDGISFFRTGDIARYDAEGYFFIVDRLKRMINASGYKVWPTEVEAVLYRHPAVQQVCVIGAPDERRGETVKAFVVLHEHARGTVTENEIIEWSKEQMAAYKYPRIVQFTDSLPISGSGKIQWRQLQEEEWKKAASK